MSDISINSKTRVGCQIYRMNCMDINLWNHISITNNFVRQKRTKMYFRMQYMT
jgi:hypothetical protein